MIFDSPNKRKRVGDISVIVLHYTEIDADATKARFLDPTQEVSAHLVINHDGTVHRFVQDDHVAYHAGQSYWKGVEGINECSIGIELVHEGFNQTNGIKIKGDTHLWTPYSPRQIDTLIQVCRGYSTKYNIEPFNIVGHSDVSPWRDNDKGKIDPGPLFPWEYLHSKGVGRWYAVGEEVIDAKEVVPVLRELGYRVTDHPEIIQLTLKAFQMHYRPNDISGRADQETLVIMAALRREIGI